MTAPTIRPGKDDDQENIEKAWHLLLETIEMNPNIELTMWQAAYVRMIVDMFLGSGLTYEIFCEEMDKIKKHYEHFWKK